MKLTQAQKDLFCLGAAMVGRNPQAAAIIAKALDESVYGDATRKQRPPKAAANGAKKRSAGRRKHD